MSRVVNTTVESNFVNGLITEATALNFPENACTDTDNCVFHQKGEVYRRYGIDFEPDFELTTVDRANKASSSFFWRNAAGLNGKDYLVVQIGSILSFYAIDQNAVSQGLMGSTVDFSTFSSAVDTTKCAKHSCQFSFGQGVLVVVNPYTEPFYVKYDPDTDTFAATQIDIIVRDTKGVDEGLGLVYNTRPTVITNKHKYNLYNQGWTEQISAYDLVFMSAYDQWVRMRVSTGDNDYPSNADVWWLFKDVNDAINYTLFEKIKRGNTPAPKGFYTYSAWNLDRDSIFADVGNNTSGEERPRCTAFHAGRAWYAGVQAQGYGTKLYYSQTVKDPDFLGTCHQLNDPTNQYLFNILATDGGEIDVIDCGTIVSLFSFQNMLLIFATNGVWVVSGNQGVGFTPTDFTIKRISAVPAISSQSFVDVDGTPVWWNNDGIYTVQAANPQIGSIQVSSLTEKTIKDFYNDIPVENKQWVQGAYNPLTRQVQWVYRYRPITTDTERYEYDRALTYNAITKALYPWTFPHKDVRVIDVVCIPAYSTTLTDAPTRLPDGSIYLDGNGEPEITRSLSTALSAAVFKYLVVYEDSPSYKMTLAEACDTSFIDFISYDDEGNDFTSYAVSGYALPGKANQSAQESYIKIFCSNQDPSVVQVQGVWDYSNSKQSGRYTNTQTVQFDEISRRRFYFRKLKIRGKGTSLQLRFSSVSGKPFNLSGWARFETIAKAP